MSSIPVSPAQTQYCFCGNPFFYDDAAARCLSEVCQGMAPLVTFSMTPALSVQLPPSASHRRSGVKSKGQEAEGP